MNSHIRACINDVRKIKIGIKQNQNWALIGRGRKTSRLRQFIFWKSLPNQRSPQGLNVYFLGCSPDRRLSECYTPTAQQSTAVFTTAARRETAPTSAGMAHANGPTARRNCYLSQLVVGTGATSGVELWRRRYNPKGDGC